MRPRPRRRRACRTLARAPRASADDFDGPVHGGGEQRALVVDDAGLLDLDFEALAFAEVLGGDPLGPGADAGDIGLHGVVVGPPDGRADLDADGVGGDGDVAVGDLDGPALHGRGGRWRSELGSRVDLYPLGAALGGGGGLGAGGGPGAA